jgi:DNA-binding transcriptional LysR family regulator
MLLDDRHLDMRYLAFVEFKHLAYFVAVADERSFTRAAARLHVVQSSVSAVIKALEREMRAPLLERTSKRVELTDAGAALLPKARAALDALDAARDTVDHVRGGLRGTVHLGMLTSIALIDLPELFGRFHRQYPEVNLRLFTTAGGSRALAEALAAGRLDLALVSPGDPMPLGVHTRELARSPLDLLLPAGHRLADRRTVEITDLADEPFVDFPIGYGNRTIVDRSFAEAGVRRHIVLEITDIAMTAAFVRHGLGIAILPRFLITDEPDLCSVTITGCDLTWPMAVATPSDRPLGAAARVLLQMLTEDVG